jgi:hypothetical protein
MHVRDSVQSLQDFARNFLYGLTIAAGLLSDRIEEVVGIHFTKRMDYHLRLPMTANDMQPYHYQNVGNFLAAFLFETGKYPPSMGPEETGIRAEGILLNRKGFKTPNVNGSRRIL